MKQYTGHTLLILLLVSALLPACNKLVSISDPTDRITTGQAFTSNDLANAAMSGVYFSMVTNSNPLGYNSVYGGLSSDELGKAYTANDQEYLLFTNHLVLTSSGGSTPPASPTDILWTWNYNIIYAANAVLEGIAASTSSQLTDTVRRQLSAEAKTVRAWCYFHLINYFGDVPLLLSSDYQAGIKAARTDQATIYRQLIQDLKDAQNNLPADYAFNKGKRTRINRWAAASLLARLYLYTKDYTNAAATATAVLNNTGLYHLETNLNNTFLIASQEAIWQINPVTTSYSFNVTPEGALQLPSNGTINTGTLSYYLTPQLLGAFETGDARKQQWVDSSTFYFGSTGTLTTQYFSYKYKTGVYNQVNGGAPIEYSMALRLAEQYLIRAEAEANGAPGGAAAAIADLNTLRSRAGLPGLPGNLSQTALDAAVAKEWQTEYFCEGPHRWFNLKRTGQAANVLSVIPVKQPWVGANQLLYPIPVGDLRLDANLKQNPGY